MWILDLMANSRRIARWRLGLSEYEFYVVGRGGVRDRSADALFCLQTTEENFSLLKFNLPILVNVMIENEEEISTVDAN